MRRPLKSAATAAAMMVACAVMGCAIVDQYGSRSVVYNTQAEQATEEALLLNIVRASLRRPMQFTALQSVTGSASASATAGVSAPVNIPFRLTDSIVNLLPCIFTGGNPIGCNTGTTNVGRQTAYPPVQTWNASGTMSGGPTFIVPILDTQEFYQGILRPIPNQVVDFYLQQGYPTELLLDIMIQKIEVTRLDNSTCRQFTFYNNVRDDLAFGQFQAFLDYLIGSGLFTEHVDQLIKVGPPIPKPEAAPSSDRKSATDLLDIYTKIQTAGLTLKDEKSKEGDEQYQIEKKVGEYRFCFAHHGAPLPDWLSSTPSIYCGLFGKATGEGAAAANTCVPGGNAGFQSGSASAFPGILLAPEFLRRMRDLQDADRAAQSTPRAEDLYFNTAEFARVPVGFKVYTRSVEGILYYLGEITRRHLQPDVSSVQPLLTQFKNYIQLGTLPEHECGNPDDPHDLLYLTRRRSNVSRPHLTHSCENIFVVDTGPAIGNSIVSTFYDGQEYSIPRDPARAGRTTQVLELVKQLLALNTSAKELPSTTVISVVGQ